MASACLSGGLVAASAVAVFALIGADHTPHSRGRPAASRIGIGGDRAHLGVERASLYASVVIYLPRASVAPNAYLTPSLSKLVGPSLTPPRS